MSSIKRLRACASLSDVSGILGFKPTALSYLLYIKADDKKYQKFSIPKRSGGERIIYAPEPDLKLLQRRLSELLQDCIENINKERGIESSISHGFRRKKSIITNAENHQKRRFVFNVDIENFFGEINFGRVRGFFIKNKNFCLPEKTATIIAQISCYRNQLPQGSPCSPVISNLIAHSLDIKLSKLAYSTGCTYSRYVDDLTFSTNKKAFPEKIAKTTETDNHCWSPGKSLHSIIKKEGFKINDKKTRMQYKDSNQEVTGLTVNKKPNVRSFYWRNVRAMVNSLVKTGSYTIRYEYKDDKNQIREKIIKGNQSRLQGMLSYIDQLDYHNKNKNKLPTRELNIRERTYREFKYFQYFFNSDKPIIICEGKTDNIYIKYAIKSLSTKHPSLAKTKETGLKVKLFNYSETTDRILYLAGGTSDISKFISTYKNMTKNFTSSPKNPVIILIDNDQGAKTIFSSAKRAGNFPKAIDGSNAFYHIYKNLYLVPIPKINNKDTDIEDYFEPNVLSFKINGKSFQREPKDLSAEYGKSIFAKSVIQRNWKAINFGNFSKILDRLEGAISNYKKII